jgi:hypothetical protein
VEKLRGPVHAKVDNGNAWASSRVYVLERRSQKASEVHRCAEVIVRLEM